MPTLAQVLIMAGLKYGPDAIDYIAKLWVKKEDPTPEEIAALKTLINKPGESYFQ